jgi:drug/metabolite transporter (DMT)-like permease
VADERIRAISQALAAAVLFGASAPLAKLLLEDIEPIPMAALLYLGGGLGALVILSIRRMVAGTGSPVFEARLAAADLPWLAGAILAGGVAAPILLLSGLATTPAGTVSLLLNLETVATTLFAAVAFREATGRRVWLAVLVITSASVLLSLRPNGAWGLSGGALAVIGACALWGLDNNLTRKVSAKNPIAIVAIKGLTAGAFSLLLALGVRSSFPSLRVGLAAMALGWASYGLSIVFFVRALRNLGAARTGALFGTAPFIGAALSFAVFPEIPTPLFLVSGLLMVVGAALLLGERHQHPHDHPVLVHDHAHCHGDGHHDHVHAPGEIPAGGYHSHRHQHAPTKHAHPHTPDLHHHHDH